MIINLEKPSLDELVHYGVLGMKWGKHKKREEDASITKAKTTLTEKKQIAKKAYDQYQKESMGGMIIPKDATVKAMQATQREVGYAKKDLKGSKILDRFKNTEKSKSQLSTEAKYKAKGMTDDEATVAAYQNIRTKKLLIAVGATTLAAATAYVAYKIHDERVDKIIKAGSSLKNVSSDDTKGIRDAFYSSNNALDAHKYKGLYGQHLRQQDGKAMLKDIKVLSDIKQASPENAKNMLSELMKTDKSFADALKDHLSLEKNVLDKDGVYGKKMKLAQISLSKGLVDKNVYEVFNASLVDHSPEMQGLTDKYFSSLANKGYNAIRDTNDQKYSGYKTLNPIISFGTKGKVEVVDVKELITADIKKSGKIANAHIAGTEFVKLGAMMVTSIIGAKAAVSGIDNKLSNTRVNKYKKENPGSKMSNTEIARMLERGK